MVDGSTIRSALAAVGAVGGQMRSFDELAAGANDALRQAPGLTALGAASFLADKAQESAYFRTTSEYGRNLRYDPYRGRGFQMITWQSNYRLFGRWLVSRRLISDAEQFVRNPASLSDYRWAWLSGVWYFEHANLWRYANAGNHLAVSQGVNGGAGRIGTSFTPNHWSARKKMYDAFRRAGNALLPTGGAAPVHEEEPDLDAEQNRMLWELYKQLVEGQGNSRDVKSWGWQSWQGGTGEKLTTVDRLRRIEVEVRQARTQLARMQAELDALKDR